jgi:hypothetical protein
VAAGEAFGESRIALKIEQTTALSILAVRFSFLPAKLATGVSWGEGRRTQEP